MVVYRDKFRVFRFSSCDFIRGLPANEDDEFLTLAAVSDTGEVGFRATQASHAFMHRLLDACYFWDYFKQCMCRPGTFDQMGCPSFIFMAERGALEPLLEEHDRYVLQCKKHKVLSRYRAVAPPAPSLLSSFLESDCRVMGAELYEYLLSRCCFFGVNVRSGEHGWGAYDLISADMDRVLGIISEWAAPHGAIRQVAVTQALPFY
ncbi:hypothetical protein [Pseudomonas sp. NPDC089401]|uniref:hypothetical protein n=1 Tax=Pseudomonas sp. NPDC089401 TaxID=3364462 RepID=UPI00381794A8